MNQDLSDMLADTEPTSEPNEDDNHIASPLDGRLIDKADPDAIIDAYEEAKQALDSLYQYQRELRAAAAELVKDGDGKTRRIKGRKRLAKLTMPTESWNQSILKEVWNSYPDKREELLRISTLAVNKRNFKKAVTTIGPDDYNNFVKMVQSAEVPPSGLPTITIEE